MVRDLIHSITFINDVVQLYYRGCKMMRGISQKRLHCIDVVLPCAELCRVLRSGRRDRN
jgi:hypothetical protein